MLAGKWSILHFFYIYIIIQKNFLVHTICIHPEYFLLKPTLSTNNILSNTQVQRKSVHTRHSTLPWMQIPLHTHLPEWVPLFWKNLKVLVRKLQWWESVEFHVCPRAKEGGQVDKCVKTQPIIAIVREVGHEYTDLEWKNRDGRGKGKGLARRKYVVTVLCKIAMKSKSHFPSSHTCNKKRPVNIITVVVTVVESKQIISHCVMA